jgi:hypothetical protein
MTNKFLLNDAERCRTRAEEARLLAKETKASETKKRCCGSGITTSTLLSGSKTGSCGVYQGTERS